MPKFRVHVFESVRVTLELEAESKADAYEKALTDPGKYEVVNIEHTGEYASEACVDPLLPDGSVDYENYEWFGMEENNA